MSIASNRSRSVVNWDDDDPMADFQPKPVNPSSKSATIGTVKPVLSSAPTTGASQAKAPASRDDTPVFTQPSIVSSFQSTKPSTVRVPVLDMKQLTLTDEQSNSSEDVELSLAAQLREEVRKQERLAKEHKFIPLYNQLVDKCKNAAKRRETFLRHPTPIQKDVVDMFEQSGVRYYEKLEHGVKVYYLDWSK